MVKIETKEKIEPVNKYLKGKGVENVGTLRQYELKPTESGVEVVDCNITRYHYKGGKIQDLGGGCMITIADEVIDKVIAALTAISIEKAGKRMQKGLDIIRSDKA